VTWDVRGVAATELLEQLGDAVTIVGPDWRYRYVSPGAAVILGRRADEVVGLHVWDDVFPEVVGTPQYDAALRAMTQRQRETIVWFFDTVGRWYSQWAIPVGDCLVFVVRDVTDAERATRRSELLVQAGEAFARATTYNDVAIAALTQALPHVGAVGGGLLLIDEEREMVQSVGLVQVEERLVRRWTEYPLSKKTPGTDAWRYGRPVHVSGLDDARVRYPDLVQDLEDSGRVAVSAFPLVGAGERLGVLVAGFAEERELAISDEQFLTTAAAMTAQALLRVRLLDAERRSLQALQRSLLPGTLPHIQGLEIAARYVASDTAAEVGGDWYDVVELPGGAVGLVMGDVEGHDLGAAALMGLIRGAVRAYALDGQPPAAVVERANTFLNGLHLGRIVTLGFMQVHPQTRLVTTVSAGHPPALFASGTDEVGELPTEIGPPLGVPVTGHRWPETTTQLDERATLVLFTDGLVESRGQDIDEGIARVAEALSEWRDVPTGQLADALLTVRADNSYDDVALVVARVTEQQPISRQVTRRLPAQPGSVHLARRFARQLLETWDIPPAVLTSAELVVSELVTNAARHSEDALDIALERRPRLLRIAVTDTSHRMPVEAPAPVEEAATSGRGLLLVESIASRWGVDSSGLSKRVWAEFDLDD
jgi:serine phosphatase RsbU (regulator of sigma subunit)/anti-sigma regulatory factor (Ser/Thr protein kinase)